MFKVDQNTSLHGEWDLNGKQVYHQMNLESDIDLNIINVFCQKLKL